MLLGLGIGSDVHGGVGQVEQTVIAGNFKNSHVGKHRALAQADLLVEHSLQDDGSIHDTLHHHVSFLIPHQLDSLAAGFHLVGLMDDGVAVQADVQLGSDGADLRFVTH